LLNVNSQHAARHFRFVGVVAAGILMDSHDFMRAAVALLLALLEDEASQQEL